jgi:hypothetical protein
MLYFNLNALDHVGRCSGRSYMTPLGAYPLGDDFVLAVACPEVDWARNVLSCGKMHADPEWQGLRARTT